MSNHRISTEVQADHIDSPIIDKFKSYFNCTIDLIADLRQGRLNESVTIQAFKTIEDNARRQSILFDELINRRLLSPNQLNTEFHYPPSVEFKFSINCILCSTHLLHQGRLDQSATVQALKTIEDNAKLQNKLFDELTNRRFSPHELYFDAKFSSRPSNGDKR